MQRYYGEMKAGTGSHGLGKSLHSDTDEIETLDINYRKQPRENKNGNEYHHCLQIETRERERNGGVGEWGVLTGLFAFRGNTPNLLSKLSAIFKGRASRSRWISE